MANKSMAYDHPTYITRQATCISLPLQAASTVAGKFVAFTAMKIKSINIGVNIAGTSTAGYDIKTQGTGTLATINVLASAAGFIGTAYVGDITLTSGQFVDIATNASGGTGVATAMIEYEITPGANVTL